MNITEKILAKAAGKKEVQPGEIIEVDGMAVVIQFDNGKLKKLNAEYARLERL